MVVIFWQLPKTSVPNEAMLAGTVTLVMVSRSVSKDVAIQVDGAINYDLFDSGFHEPFVTNVLFFS